MAPNAVFFPCANVVLLLFPMYRACAFAYVSSLMLMRMLPCKATPFCPKLVFKLNGYDTK